MNVGYAKNLSIRDIEKRVNLEKSKVSRAASKLEKKGYLVKRVDSGDRRLLQLALTNDGVALLNELIPLAQEFQNQLNRKLGKKLKEFHTALDELVAPKT